MAHKVSVVGVVAHENYGSREIFSRIVADHPDKRFVLFVTTGLFYKKSFLASVWKLLREASFIFCFVRFLELLLYKIKGDTLVKRARAANAIVIYTSDINSEESHRQIKKYAVDLLVSTFTMHILSQKTIELPPLRTIGTHPSILPNYRGLEVFFWALANREQSSGVSVFYLDRRIDAGQVFLQETFEILPSETVESIYKKLTQICARLLSDAVLLISQGAELRHFEVVGKGSYYPMPTRAAYRRFRRSGHRWFGEAKT